MSTTISGTSGVTFPDSTSMQTGQQACKAWVSFNGQGTVAIRGSYNVSSITDVAAGKYTVNFTIAMADANYAVTTGGTDTTVGYVRVLSTSDGSRTTTSVGVAMQYAGASSAGYFDYPENNVAIFSN